MLQLMNFILSSLTLITGLFLLFIVAFLLYLKLSKQKKKRVLLKKHFDKNGAKYIFIISLVATLGSLFYSEIAGFNPCTLCWFQRIFMYPLVIISGLMLNKNSKELLNATSILAGIGAVFAGIHYFNQFIFPSLSCSVNGADCAIRSFVYYGYITIPMMALTAFLAILFISGLLIFYKK